MLDQFSLYLVTDTTLIGKKGLTDVVLRAAQGGVTAVQLREKELSTKAFVKAAKDLKEVLKPFSIPLIINDRVDIALAVGADGVHLGQTDLNFFDARRIMGKNFIIGLTVENIEQAQEAMNWDVDYLGVSSLFKTHTKVEAVNYWSQKKVMKLKSMTQKSLIGIGGINEGNAKNIISWGLDGIAVASAICSAANLLEVEAEAKKLKNIVRSFYENI